MYARIGEKIAAQRAGFTVPILQVLSSKSRHYTVRPRDTRPRAARTLQVHVFELGPKKFEMNEFM